jgi:hypothetical protein
MRIGVTDKGRATAGRRQSGSEFAKVNISWAVARASTNALCCPSSEIP